MTSEEFIKAIKQSMSQNMSGLIKFIENPPGRKPSQSLLMISKFYKDLNDADRNMFREALELASRLTICNFLDMLDGSAAIESSEKKGKLELYYNDGVKCTRLNEPEGVPLNDLFRNQ